MLRIAFPSERNPATAGREKPIEIPAEYRLQNILFVILQGVMRRPAAKGGRNHVLSGPLEAREPDKAPGRARKAPAEPGRSHRAQNAPEEP